jgi:hypothetical protein
MDRVPVTSSNIASVGHDPATNTLEIEFKGGGVYHYAGVDAAKHAALVNASSVGGHFHQHIKPSHAHTKLDKQ